MNENAIEVVDNIPPATPTSTLKRAFKREVPVKLDRNEVHDYGKQLARKRIERAAVDARRLNVVAQFKGQLAEQDAVINRLTAAIDTGEELRSVECGEYHEGSHKVVRILATGEEVDRAPLTWADQQESLPGLDDDFPSENHQLAAAPEMVTSSTGAVVAHMPDDEAESPAEDPVPPRNGANGKAKRGRKARSK